MSTLTPLIQPVFLKFIIDDLIARKFPIQWVIAYGGARFAGSLFVELRNIVWANVSALQERDIALQTFVHLQALSLEWHLNRKTGSVLRSISRGASSFSTVLRILMFSIFPVFIQVIVVSSYFFATYQWYFGVITFCVILVYVCFTFSVTEWRNKFRREMNEKDNEFNQKGTDALLNFQTVKYFNAERHEANRYDESLQAFRAASIISQQTLAILNGGQSFVIALGVTIVMILAAALVKNGEHTVGDFVLLQQYIITLYQPLGFLGSYYRMMKQTLVDVESMFNLWNQKPEIQNDPDAVELQIKDCRIEFNDVVFSYPKDPDRRVLDGVSFVVEPGQKVAIVGSTGAGKSTISRLLYRFYDLKSGSIMIDGQDISLVTVHSLRSHIGIVPQDCVLFNDTIGYNIGYGVYGYNPKGPTKNDIENAARAANIHDFIVKQPNGYEQRVGERGLRLSGGEKQRVAIARAILKRPEIMIFDEATSALDTKTEQQIQKELDQAAQGRTSLTIAHRLSTIMNSDQILVLKNGFVAERGTHDELLEMRGEYHEMWRLQEEHERLKEALADVVQAQKRHSESALVKQASTESE